MFAIRSVYDDLDDAAVLARSAVLCFLHEHHIVVLGYVAVLGSWQSVWVDNASETAYVSGVATSANTWRNTGNNRKIEEVFVELCYAEVAFHCVP